MSHFLRALPLIFSLFSALLYCESHNSNSSSSSSCESSEEFFCRSHLRHNTNNTYGPNLKIATTPFRLTDCTIFSLGAEGGSNNLRFNGTFGFFMSPKIHLKVTAEQLYQRVGYSFTSGKLRKWMGQFAIGGVVQYELCHRWIESIELYGSYADCRSKKLCPRPCCVCDTNLLDRVSRHISGGKDGFGGLGVTVLPWRRAVFSIAANYDYLTYRRKFSDRLVTQGFGGTAKLHQDFGCGVSIDLKAELRRPFSYYEGALNWTNTHPYGILTFGFYGGYTKGRDHLPNNWTTGLLVSADFGGIPFFSNYLDCGTPPCVSGCVINPSFPVDSELVAWVATPAVHMPTILAVSEEIVCHTDRKCPPPPKPHPHPPEPPVCEAPKSVTIPNQTSLPIDTSAFFDPNGHAMVFTAQGLPHGFFINPVTGIIHGDIFDVGIVAVRVTGTTECGSTSESFLIINENNPYGPYTSLGEVLP